MSRYSFPGTCEIHFSDNKTTANSWMEAEDQQTIASLNKHLPFIPKIYDADCCHCFDCGGVKFNMYRGCDYPTESGSDLLWKFHRREGSGRRKDCKNNSDHCDALCWNGGYFRRWNHKYIHFFDHFLQYCSENCDCECYWPELDEEASTLNQTVYDLLKEFSDQKILTAEFSPYWKATWYYYNYYYGEKMYPTVIEPNAHGIASSLTTYTFFYSQYHQMLLAVAEFIDNQSVFGDSLAIDRIYTILEELRDEFSYTYNRCLRWHPHPKIYYERGMLRMHSGDYENALSDVNRLMRLAESHNSQNDLILTSEMYQQEGEIYFEQGVYDKAIDALAKAIKKDPTNRGAYFSRAQAYFEIGEFDKSIKDFLSSNDHKNTQKTQLKPPVEIKDAILKGLLEGGGEAAVDFVPSLCETACGLGTALWQFAEHPIDSSVNVVNSCYDISKNIYHFFENIDSEDLDCCVEEIKRIHENFDKYSESEKGYLTGYLVGKYGVDIFAGGAALKGVTLCKRLKTANRMANLEALTSSEKSRETIKTAGLVHATKREAFFKNVKIHWDKQNKHVLGKHNYVEGKSIFEHPNPQFLVDKFAGKGIPTKNRIPGTPDYREKVNFREFIGYHVNKSTGVKTPTTWGEIRYSKTGAHIVPAFPKESL